MCGGCAGLQIVLVPYFPIFWIDDGTDDDDNNDDDLQCRSNQQTELTSDKLAEAE